MRSSSLLAATIAASLFAGPLFLASLFAVMTVMNPGGVLLDDIIGGGWTLVVVIFLSVPLGFFFACLPIALGFAVMSWLGWRAPESRSPILWLAVGAAFAAAISVALGRSLGLGVSSDQTCLILAVIISGAVCAGICRRMASWPDDT